MKLTRIALAAGAALLLNTLISAQDCAEVELSFEYQKADLSGSSWRLLDGLGYAFRQASYVDVSVSVPKGFFIPDHGQDIYSRRLAILERWVTEEAVDLSKVKFRLVEVPYGEVRSDAVVEHDGCGEPRYRPPMERDTTLMLGRGIELRCMVRDAEALGGVRVVGLDWAEEAMGQEWPATEVVGVQRDVVGLVQIHMPDSVRNLPHGIRFPLPDGLAIRRGDLLIPTRDGLHPTNERLRLKAEDGTTFAHFSAPHAGPFAIASAVERGADEEQVEVLAPDGWVFERVAWRTAHAWHEVPLGESPYRARFPAEAVSDACEYTLRLRSPDGQVLEWPWSPWAALPWAVRPIPRLHRPGQIDDERLLFHPQSPRLCRVHG